MDGLLVQRQKPDGYYIGFIDLPGTNTVILDPERKARFGLDAFTPITQPGAVAGPRATPTARPSSESSLGDPWARPLISSEPMPALCPPTPTYQRREPERSQGLAPRIEDIMAVIQEMRDEGIALLLVEQNSSMALGLADRTYLIDDGRIVHAGPAAKPEASPALKHRLLPV